MKVVMDGLFGHPEGDDAAAVLKRMVQGTTNYRLDDPFKPAMDETHRELKRLEKQIHDAEWRLASLRNAQERARQRLADQEAAKARYAETGEIDPVLVPSAERLAEADVAAAKEAVKKQTDFQLPSELEEQGWHQKGPIRVTDHEIIVTISKARTEDVEPMEQVERRLAKAIAFALEPYRVDDAHFRRVLHERIAARLQQPREPPGD